MRASAVSPGIYGVMMPSVYARPPRPSSVKRSAFASARERITRTPFARRARDEVLRFNVNIRSFINLEDDTRARRKFFDCDNGALHVTFKHDLEFRIAIVHRHIANARVERKRRSDHEAFRAQ
jgi:hypothetical protein